MNTLEFVKQTSADPAACDKMAACETPQEAYAVAEAAGVTDSFEDFVASMEEIRAQVSEVSEDDLEGLNAGLSTTGLNTVIASAGTSICAAGAAAI